MAVADDWCAAALAVR